MTWRKSPHPEWKLRSNTGVRSSTSKSVYWRCNGVVIWGPDGNNTAATTANFDSASEGICVLRLASNADPDHVYDDVTLQVRQPNSGFSRIFVSPLLSTKTDLAKSAHSSGGASQAGLGEAQ